MMILAVVVVVVVFGHLIYKNIIVSILEM